MISKNPMFSPLELYTCKIRAPQSSYFCFQALLKTNKSVDVSIGWTFVWRWLDVSFIAVWSPFNWFNEYAEWTIGKCFGKNIFWMHFSQSMFTSNSNRALFLVRLACWNAVDTKNHGINTSHHVSNCVSAKEMVSWASVKIRQVLQD